MIEPIATIRFRATRMTILSEHDCEASEQTKTFSCRRHAAQWVAIGALRVRKLKLEVECHNFWGRSEACHCRYCCVIGYERRLRNRYARMLLAKSPRAVAATSGSSLELAASRYCDARETAERIRAQVEGCDWTHGCYCSKAHTTKQGSYGEPYQEKLPVEEWCVSCQRSASTLGQLGAARRKLGGYAAAMFRAYRAMKGAA